MNETRIEFEPFCGNPNCGIKLSYIEPCHLCQAEPIIETVYPVSYEDCTNRLLLFVKSSVAEWKYFIKLVLRLSWLFIFTGGILSFVANYFYYQKFLNEVKGDEIQAPIIKYARSRINQLQEEIHFMK